MEDRAVVSCFLVGVYAEQGNCYLLVLKDVTDKCGTIEGVFERIRLVEVFRHRVQKFLSDRTVHIVSLYEVVGGRSDKETLRWFNLEISPRLVYRCYGRQSRAAFESRGPFTRFW